MPALMFRDLPPAGDDLDLPRSQKRRRNRPCGAEDRISVADPSKAPWSAICYLVSYKRRGTYRGTGFFISPTAILTAGHNIYTRSAGMSSRIDVIPGRNGRSRPFGTVSTTRFFMPPEWRSRRAAAFDYGVIKLDAPWPNARPASLDWTVASDEEVMGGILTTSGYPSDLADSRKQHTNSGPCKKPHPMRLEYMLDTWKGASGSPVWLGPADKPQVVGIHNYGHCPNWAIRVPALTFVSSNDRTSSLSHPEWFLKFK